MMTCFKINNFQLNLKEIKDKCSYLVVCDYLDLILGTYFPETKNWVLLS